MSKGAARNMQRIAIKVIAGVAHPIDAGNWPPGPTPIIARGWCLLSMRWGPAAFAS